MFNDFDLFCLVLIPTLPLAAAALTAILGPKLLRDQAHVPAVVGVGSAFILSLFLLASTYRQAPHVQVGHGHGGHGEHAAAGHDASHAEQPKLKKLGYEKIYTLWTWLDVDDAIAKAPAGSKLGPAGFYGLDLSVTLRIDPLTSIMLCTITFVGLLVVIYSIGYLHADRGYWRYFSYVALFVFSMTMLVSSSSFLLLYVFWEGVGVCSYLLIGFWYTKPSAAEAGKKAFLVNRIGDVGLALGVFLIWCTFGTLNFHDVVDPITKETLQYGVFGSAGRLVGADGGFLGAGGSFTLCAIALLLFIGAMGKSAQFPLHVWLPDAMEGPTPASALIHAATMVTAGVYLTARCSPLFVLADAGMGITAMSVVAAIGGFTALLAALIALTQNDLKRVLAYSTVSQLGFMFLGIGAGTLAGVTSGMFHLFTHAWFKALLFLGAGSVMHSMGHVIDMRKFDGLRRVLPITCFTFAIGSLALAGFPFLAGFYSKDEILAALYERSLAYHEQSKLLGPASPDASAGFLNASNFYYTILCLALFSAFLTAFYTARAFFLTFFGPLRTPPEAGPKPHESPAVMTVPMILLAAGTCVVGLFGQQLCEFLAATPTLHFLAVREAALPAPAVGDFHTTIMGVSVLVAVGGIGLASFLYLADRRELQLLEGAGLVRTFQTLSLNKFYLDEIYQVLFVAPFKLLGDALSAIDRWLVDGLVDFVGKIPLWAARGLRWTGNGLVHFYALVMALGVLALAAAAGVLDPPVPPKKPAVPPAAAAAFEPQAPDEAGGAKTVVETASR